MTHKQGLMETAELETCRDLDEVKEMGVGWNTPYGNLFPTLQEQQYYSCGHGVLQHLMSSFHIQIPLLCVSFN
ncbi:Hypothetical predicted protein [Octopus vulgaris]|uniref:Uncharacterized protein n=1 Tax=Octopus vulgaris TaxID=6645 RepID=A0AA36FF91_OCTVU|nr:Hypothetical predicted protein [Octopus vulgaris]